jgi:hypothetical protein
MQVSTENFTHKVTASRYTLAIAPDRPYVYLFDLHNEKAVEFFALSSVHTMTGRDDTVKIGAWSVEKTPEKIVLSVTAESSIWKSKTYRFHCYDNRIAYEIEVEGQGDLTEVVYFGGCYSGQVRWGSGFFWSGHKFLRGFNPEPTTDEQFTFHPAGGSSIDMYGVPLPGKASWFFTPPPFCFAFETNAGWLTMGLEAAPGQNRFTDYQYRGQGSAFSLNVNYDGVTRVDGTYKLPTIGIDFADDPYEALALHVDALRAQGLVAARQAVETPEWWYEPIYCGWGSQCYIASLEKGRRAPDYARQELYDGFLKTLEQNDVSPGIVVLDDKWQATYGDNEADPEKWPDIVGFIEEQHAAGRKVLLWLKAWDAEGLPPELCITNAAGLPLSVDPTNPAFEARFRASIRRMLSAEGYNADGFKIDFTARIPCSPHANIHEPVWGLELMRRYLWIIYDEAKQVKPDALVMAHTPHPYLADVIDMIRLNDIVTEKHVNGAMRHRARIAGIACPDAIIDTDNWPIPNKATWRAYGDIQTKLGVPSLYYATHIDTTGEPLTPDDYAFIRALFASHREGVKRCGARDERV